MHWQKWHNDIIEWDTEPIEWGNPFVEWDTEPIEWGNDLTKVDKTNQTKPNKTDTIKKPYNEV